MTSGSGDRGSASVWVLACSAVVLVVALAVTARCLAVLARHRVETAADLAALAAAGSIGLGRAPCEAAAAIAAANRASLVQCTAVVDASGRSGVVSLRLSASVRLPGLAVRYVDAEARAERAPGTAAAPSG